MTAGVRSIQMTFCRVDYRLGGDPRFVVTHFPDGRSYGATPAFTPEYSDLAKRCGYVLPATGGAYADIWRYCLEHEVAHSLIAEVLYRAPSRVIWDLAHGDMAGKLDILHEEELAISLQAFARAGHLPGSSAPGFSWFAIRDRFLALLDTVEVGAHA